MMPWGHFAVVYLPYLVYRLVAHRKLPTRRATVFLLVATQLPDLIDKPLAWGLHLLPSGRSLAHSLLVAVPLVVVVSLLTYRRGRPELGALFTAGYLSHVFADVYRTLLNVPPDQWASSFVASLYWPLLPVEPAETTAFLHYFARVEPSRYAQVAVGLALFAVVFAAPEIRGVLGNHRPSNNGPASDVASSERGFNAD